MKTTEEIAKVVFSRLKSLENRLGKLIPIQEIEKEFKKTYTTEQIDKAIYFLQTKKKIGQARPGFITIGEEETIKLKGKKYKIMEKGNYLIIYPNKKGIHIPDLLITPSFPEKGKKRLFKVTSMESHNRVEFKVSYV